MKRTTQLTVCIALMVSGMLFGAQSTPSQNNAKPSTSADDQNAPPSQSKPDSSLLPPPSPEPPKKGTAAPDFTLTDLKGARVQLSSFKGKAVVVNFWATWCEPCKIEMPWIVDLQKKYGPQGLQVLGVAMDDADEATIQGFATKMGVNYPVLKGTEKVADQYGGLDGLPATFFVDRSGNIVDEAVGLMSESVIEDAIKHALGQGQDKPAPTGEK